MDFLRFAKSQRYRSRVPLRQLQFTVAVYRAIVVEEDKRELLAEVTVPWDGKVFSPAEMLALHKDVAHLLETALPAIGGGGQRASVVTVDGVGGVTAAAAERSGTLNASAAPPPLSAAAVGEAAPASLPQMPALPPPAEIIAQLRKPSSSFFTRPSLEDFIDTAEEDFPVDPPQGPSRLAPVILRQHRRDHQPNRKMYLMWASGDVTVQGNALPPMASSPHVSVPPQSPPPVPPSTSSVSQMTVTPPSASPSAQAPVELNTVNWQGIERVLCTLTAEEDERVFTAKPNLQELHTLFVDAAYIYTFCVTVAKADATVASRRMAGWMFDGQHNGPALSSAAGGAFSASTTPLDAVLANVRELAEFVEEQCETLEVGKDAVARRLLRQAALMAAPERGGGAAAGGGHATAGGGGVGGGGAGGLGSAGGALMSPLEGPSGGAGGGRRGRGAVGFDMSLTHTAGDRVSMAAAGSGTLAGIQQRGAGTGVGLLSRSGVMRGGHALPRGLCQYYIFGTVDRTVGVAESTLFLRCQILEDGASSAWMYDPIATSSPSAVCEFSSQLAHVSTFIADEFLFDIDHVFNLPFDYTFVGAALPSSPLRLVVTAFTEGAAAEGLQSPVGYTCISLPIATPGHHKVRAAMWAPHKTGLEYLRSTLLGGAPSLVDARQTAPPPAHRTGISVKEGLYADSVGVLHLSLNVLHHKNQS